MGSINLSQPSANALALGNLLLVSPQTQIGYQPQNPLIRPGEKQAPLPSFLFHYEGEQTVNLTSDITDHYIEDNTAIQDQIAIKPLTITTQGFIGELNDVVPRELQILKAAAEKLTIISAYTPVLSVTALNAYNQALALYQQGTNAVNQAVATVSSINGDGIETGGVITNQNIISGGGITVQPNQNKQQLAFQQFYGYYIQRTLFTVQTPWAVFQDMAIQTFRAIQPADSESMSEFEITFKLMRFARTITLRSELNSEGRLSSQSSTLIDKGQNTPKADIGLGEILA